VIASICRICGLEQVTNALDLGPQPISNRFTSDPSEPEFRHSLKIGQCQACGLVQLAEPFPSHELRPRVEWIRYREREDHLEQAVAAFLPFLDQLSEGHLAFGITDFDGVLLQHLLKRLPLTCMQLSPPRDLGIPDLTFGMETFQQALTQEHARHFVEHQGKCQILVSRYLFEHAENPLALLAAYRELLADDGFLLLEVPDAEAPLQRHDYQMIWEEHVSYFTEHSLRLALEGNGFSIRSVFKASSKFEQPLLVLAQKHSERKALGAVSPADLTRFEMFRRSFPNRRQAFRDFCRQGRDAGQTVVLFGAGHFTVAFVNFFGLEEYLSFVIDDDPNKIGLFLAGTSLPIVSSDHLSPKNRVLVLLCVNPDVESRVVEKLNVFIRDRTKCYSVFTASPRFCLHEQLTSS